MRDVWVSAPPAIYGVGLKPLTEMIPPPGVEVSKDDIIQMQQAEIRALRSELEKLRVAANTIANTAACLAALAEPDHQGWVTVPREMRQRMRDDVKLSIRNTPEGTQLRWVTRPGDHSFEGRADG